MAVNAILLFGQDIEDFSTIDRAFHTCFRAMVGDWDWVAMVAVGRVYAGVWFWIFQLVMVIILLNMLLAVLMDSYGTVKQDAGNAQPLSNQVSEMIRRRRQFKRKERVRLNDIWDAHWEQFQDDEALKQSEMLITVEDVLKQVPGIKKTQVLRTMKNAILWDKKQKPDEFKLENAKAKLEKVDELLRVVHYDATEIRDKINAYDSMPVDSPTYDAAPVEPNVIVETTSMGLGRLCTEMADVLSQEMQRLEKQQECLEQRQGEMVFIIKDMHHTMKQLHKESSELSEALSKQA